MLERPLRSNPVPSRRAPGGRVACPIGLTLLLACGAPGPREVALPNDNRRPAGQLADGVLRLDLELRAARWSPEGKDGPALPVHVFAQAGQPATVPGPMIRVPEGTELHLTIRNTLPDSTLILYGLHTRPGSAADTLQLRPGSRRELRFTAGAPGTYYYWGSTTHRGIEEREWLDSQLSGALIVDSSGTPPVDRVFVLGIWSHLAPTPAVTDPDTGEVMTINGLAWPHTERFRLPVGDTVHWRWVNPSSSSHPMHLHGVFYAVESRGDGTRDTAFAPEMQPLVVTDLLLPGATMAMHWAPAHAGNWIFHCHFAAHASPLVSMDRGAMSAHHRMAGLVLGIEATGPDPVAVPARPERRLRLLAQSAPHRVRDGPGYGYVLQTDNREPAPDSIAIPGVPLILERGEPVAITVVNRLQEPTAVHWHGMELTSYPDGVPGWSGINPALAPAIQPGDSFTARFTPPRAGTFIYHTHLDEVEQMTRGLYGPMLVVEPGTRIDPATDHLVIVGGNGPVTGVDSVRSLVNGKAIPAPMVLRPGRVHRLRLINIDPDHRILFQLFRGSALTTWRAVAKDGATLPPPQATVRMATLLTGPGETADFLFAPAGQDDWRLDISAPYADTPWTLSIPMSVR